MRQRSRGFPGAQAGPPRWHRASVGLVVRAESAGESRFLVPADECGGDHPEGRGVRQQNELAEDERLTDYDRQYRHIHGVADIAIQSADDQALGSGDRCRSPEALHDETYERLDQSEQSAASSITPSTRMGAQYGTGSRTRQPVNHHGIRPATIPGPTRKNTALPTAAAGLRMVTCWRGPSLGGSSKPLLRTRPRRGP